MTLIRFLVGAFLIVVAIVSPAHGSSWPMHQFDAQNSGLNVEEKDIRVPLELRWNRSHGQSIYETRTRPVIADGVIYVGASWGSNGQAYGSLRAISLDTGQVLWSLNGLIIQGTPALSNGRIYFGTRDGNFYAIKAKDGQLIWQIPTDGIATAPVIFADMVFFGTTNGKLYAVNAENGEVLWALSMPYGALSMPAITNGALLVGGGRLLAVDPIGGNIKWSFSPLASSCSAPAIKGSSVFIGSNYRLYCLDIESGRVKWSYPTIDMGGYLKTPVIAGNTLFWGTVTAFDPDTGTVKWAFDSQNSYRDASVAVANGYVFVGSSHRERNEVLDTSDGRLYVLKADTGELVWQYLAGRKFNDWYGIDPSPSVAEGSVVLNLSTSQLCRFTAVNQLPILDLTVNKPAINPYDPEQGCVDLSFSVDSTASITIDIQDFRNSTVRRLVDNKTFGKGMHSVTWHGLIDFPEMADPYLAAEFGDKSILAAPDGNYKFVVTARVDSAESYSAITSVKVEASI